MSERASTSSSGFSGSTLGLGLSLSLILLCGSGDARVLRGVDAFPSIGLLCVGDVVVEPGKVEALRSDCDKCLFSANLFSNVRRSVRPLSSSLSSPTLC
jgi:hypothetical protein